jgi:hypothetical protein
VVPSLTFFCELEPEPLERLFAQPAVIDALVRLRAGVSLGLLDLSPARASVVRELQRASVPVTAWLLLPVEHGYFQHVGNFAESAARFEELCAWSAREGLSWAGVGLDVEQDRRDLEGFGRAPWRAAPITLRRALDGQRLRRGLQGYRELLGRIAETGWPVEVYQFPSIADDRATGSTLLQRAFGMMDLPVEREVWMLYSSILPPRGPGWLCSYGPEARAIAVGSTGGGIDSLPKLGWAELKRDLLLARRWTERLYIFSLEGCVSQELLPRLVDLDWSEPVGLPERDRRQVDRLRRLLRVPLRLSAWLERLTPAGS